MSDRIELQQLRNLRTVKGARDSTGFFDGHYEAPLVRGDKEYSGDGQYSQYLGDHNIAELYLGSPMGAGGMRNWREYAGRLARFDKAVANEVFLLYEEPLSLALQHSYKKIGDTSLFQRAGGGGTGFAKLAGQGLAAVRSGGGLAGALSTSDVMITPSRFLEAQFYENSSPWMLNTTFTFRFGQYGLWSCYEEVFKPALSLLAMAAPTILDKEEHILGQSIMEAPGPTQFGLIMSMTRGLVGAGMDGFNADAENSPKLWDRLTSMFQGFAEESAERERAAETLKSLTLAIGQTYQETATEAGTRTPGSTATRTRNMFIFSPCVLKGCTATFSKEKDMAGYPIQATVKLEIETQLPATTQNLSAVESSAAWRSKGRSSSTAAVETESSSLQEDRRRHGAPTERGASADAQTENIDALQ